MDNRKKDVYILVFFICKNILFLFSKRISGIINNFSKGNVERNAATEIRKIFCGAKGAISDIGLSSSPILSSLGNNVIISLPETGEILVYDLNGNLKTKDKIGWASYYISVKEQQEIQQKAIDRLNKKEGFDFAKWVSPEENKIAVESIVKEMESDLTKIKDPIPIPVFSIIIKDSDGNLLFFEYPRKENANKFNVWIYENKGKFVCQSSFVCDDYNLNINPSKMVFYKGYIYGLQLLKKADGVPLRLVRFKLVSSPI